ncbi:FliM/FliN family flagellar motor switch protein [Pantoea sp. PNT02]|uniref:FliM/FliN family flagellar motor switch protein n=1 Tax=Pantoea sp. PNT02 TaxID=2769261 RepID=UPI0017876624|nr:FliM/FliN family flagellar motor switch protein [Pantoea sp. PNT02]
MNQPHNPAWLALSRHIGEARISPCQGMLLTSGSLRGEYMVWSDANSKSEMVTGKDAWLNWVADVAPATSPQDYAPDVLAALSHWTFQPLAPLLSREALNTTLQPEHPAALQQGLIFRLRRNGRLLDVLLRSADWHRVHQAVAGWLPASSAAPVASLPLQLVIGRSQLTAQSCRALQPGSALVLQHTPDLAASGLWLVLGKYCAGATLQPDGRVLLNSEFNPLQAAHALAAGDHNVENIPLTLTAEIGEVSLTLGELQQLQPGDVLEQLACLNDLIQLKVNGYTVAWGQLMQAENGWLVRICQRPDAVASDVSEEDAWTR